MLILLSVALIAFNATMVDLNNPFNGDSTVALIGIMAPLCAIILLCLYMTSKKVEQKLKNN